MKSNLNCYAVAWISDKQLACGYDDGKMEIHEIESRNRQLNSRMVQKIIHVQRENGKYGFSMQFPDFPTMHTISKETSYYVMSIIWNEELNLLASGGTDQRVKVLKQNAVYIMK